MTSTRNKHFFVIGAQRSGTTYLYNLLDEHPDIGMAKPVRPEPKFFLKPDLSGYSYEDYLTAFFPEPDRKRLGEKTTSYIESEQAAQRIAEWFPDAPIIIILREPIARAISNYHFTCNHNLEPLPLDQAFRQEEQRRDAYDHEQISASPYAYLIRGRYIDYLRTWDRHIDRSRMIVLIHEEFVGSLEAAQKLYAQLGVDATYEPALLKQVANASEKRETVLDPELEAYLIDYFADSTAELEDYLGHSLAVWRRDSKT